HPLDFTHPCPIRSLSLKIDCFRHDPGDCSSFVREIMVVTLATKRSFLTKVGLKHETQHPHGLRYR
ncbi:MAG: hypothetical protein O9304_21625, partial [Microcystis sp. LE19-114.1B]|uniref:hypothetical protein n=1 Tax=Microcystis sp. M049S2 TaxID=2771169 RepID=UPI0022BFBE7F